MPVVIGLYNHNYVMPVVIGLNNHNDIMPVVIGLNNHNDIIYMTCQDPVPSLPRLG
jgi:hypothetical protein